MKILNFILVAAVCITTVACQEKVSEDNIRKISSELNMHQKEYEGIKEIYKESITKRDFSRLNFNKKIKEIKKADNDALIKNEINVLNEKYAGLSAEQQEHVIKAKAILDSSSAFIAKINNTIKSDEEAFDEWKKLNDAYETEANGFYRNDKQLGLWEIEFSNMLAKAKEKENSKSTKKGKKR